MINYFDITCKFPVLLLNLMLENPSFTGHLGSPISVNPAQSIGLG
jgi:hypothetical protein